MRGFAPVGAFLALLVATAIASAAPAQPLPSVEISWPAPGTATNADMLAVTVRFAAAGNVHAVALELDGREVGRAANPPRLKSGSIGFTAPLAGAGEGLHRLQAFAFQGDERAGLRGASARVPLLLDRTPPLLSLDVANGTFAAEPRIVLHGSVSDALSGVASLTCAGAPVAVAASFECAVALTEGANEVVVRATDRAGNTTSRRLTLHYQPGGLTGSPGTPALDAVEDVFAPSALVVPAEITDSVVRTQLELVLARDADTAAVNALLRRIGARIVSSREGVLIVVVRIPDPGSLDALRTLVASLALDPALRAAEPALMPSPDALPDIIAPGSADVSLLRSQLAVRAHAAWNARAALEDATPPTLVVADFFGGGPPGSLFGVTATSADFATSSADEHGWMVLGIAAGAFDPVGAALAADAVTGIYPGTLPVRVADVRLGLAGATLDDRILELVENAPGDAVVNTSMGSPCGTPAGAAGFCTRAAATRLALRWIERVRGSDPSDPGANLENDFVHVTSAGNVNPSPVGATGAELNSKWSAAALLSPLVDPASGLTVSNLANTLVVESFTATAAEPFRPGCSSPTAEVGGTIAAIGSPVHSFDSPTTARNHGDGGASAATPQVAGTAAYVWALAPGLTPTQVVQLLETTARPSSAGCGGAPVLDAYAALLAADAGTARAVRDALLDADGDGDFDHADLAAFVTAFGAGGAIDYGDHDLNGDGRTGGNTRDRLDLDLDTAADRWSDTQEQTIQTIPVRYEDAAVTDLDVLCYYAHTALYDGDPSVRDQFAAEQCLELTLETTFPTTVEPGVDHELVIRARRPNGLLQPGLHLELSPIGGSVADTAGFTGVDGALRTSGRLFAGASELRVLIVARAGAGGAEIARKTVVATRASTSTGVVKVLRAAGMSIACCSSPPCPNVVNAPDDVSSWSDSFSCHGVFGDFFGSGPGEVTVTNSFTLEETLAGGRLVALTTSSTSSANAIGGPASSAFGVAQSVYILEFEVDEPIDVSVRGSLSKSDPSGVVRVSLSGNTVLIHRTTPGAFDHTFTLQPGLYRFQIGTTIAADTSPINNPLSATGAFQASVTFD